MKLTANTPFLLMVILVPHFVFAQERPLFPVPELSKFAVHQTCTDKVVPHKLILERYELYKITRKNKFPVNAFADVLTVVKQNIKLMTYYVFDSPARIYNRQFVKINITNEWQEVVDEKKFRELLLKHLTMLPREYFATGSEANHSMFASGILKCN